jgi:hypothetical protein
MDFGVLVTFVKGGPLTVSVRQYAAECGGVRTYETWATRPCYLYLDSQTDPARRIRLVYVPGGTGNDAVREETSPGVWRLVFARPSEWTRTSADVIVGLYDLTVRIGPETGTGSVVQVAEGAVRCVTPTGGALS